jgi:hypothetical protein
MLVDDVDDVDDGKWISLFISFLVSLFLFLFLSSSCPCPTLPWALVVHCE